MKTLPGICILLGLSVSLSAQQDPAAEPYLDKISATLDPGHTVRIDFDYTREDLQSGSNVAGEGTLFLQDENYRIVFEEAMIWFDGETQYSLNKEVEEVYISKPDPDDKEFMFSDPIRLLRSYKEEFKYVLLGKGEIRSIECMILQLDPMELGGPYAVLKLFVNPVTRDLVALQVRHKEGILYTMVITELDRVEKKDEAFFRFNASDYPMVDVIELVN